MSFCELLLGAEPEPMEHAAAPGPALDGDDRPMLDAFGAPPEAAMFAAEPRARVRPRDESAPAKSQAQAESKKRDAKWATKWVAPSKLTGDLMLDTKDQWLDRPADDTRLRQSGQTAESSAAAQAKANSTSTIFVSSTLAQPDAEQLVTAAAAVLHGLLQDDAATAAEPGAGRDEAAAAASSSRSSGPPVSLRAAEQSRLDETALNCFDVWEAPAQGEEGQQSQKRQRLRAQLPSVQAVESFLSSIFRGRFSPEVTIITLVYVYRLRNACPNSRIMASNWEALVISAILLAQKVWDDNGLPNSQFRVVLGQGLGDGGTQYTLQQLSRYESRFLQLIGFAVNVTPMVYARYYFELRHICQASSGADLAMPALSTHQARRLDLRSSRLASANIAVAARSKDDLGSSPRAGGRYVL